MARLPDNLLSGRRVDVAVFGVCLFSFPLTRLGSMSITGDVLRGGATMHLRPTLLGRLFGLRKRALSLLVTFERPGQCSA